MHRTRSPRSKSSDSSIGINQKRQPPQQDGAPQFPTQSRAALTDRAWRHWPADHARPRLESISAPCSQRRAIAGIPCPPCRVARLGECSGSESERAPFAWTMGEKVPAAAGRSACRPFQGLDCDGLGSGPLSLSVRPPAQKMGASAGTWRPLRRCGRSPEFDGAPCLAKPRLWGAGSIDG